MKLASGYGVEELLSSAVDDETMRSLHALANAMAAEPLEHFARHAADNDVLYVYRAPSGDLAGFQFYKTFGDDDGVRYVRGGKLRIRPESRRKGLHIASGLHVLRRERELHPGARVRRLAVVNPFGFFSLIRRVAHYEFIGPGENEDLHAIVARECTLSDYRFDPQTGLCHVGIIPSKSLVESYPASFWSSELVQTYMARNPGYRENGTNLALVFDADEDNLAALERGLAEIEARANGRVES